jgi:hypothetical protein
MRHYGWSVSTNTSADEERVTHAVLARVVETAGSKTHPGEEGKAHRKSDCELHGDWIASGEQLGEGCWRGQRSKGTIKTLSFILGVIVPTFHLLGIVALSVHLVETGDPLSSRPETAAFA